MPWHKSVETTMIYLHVARKLKGASLNPLDILEECEQAPDVTAGVRGDIGVEGPNACHDDLSRRG